jgi:DNA-directed RNA polymerase specialized sigma24 family protein
MDELLKFMKALVLLELRKLETEAAPTKPEVLLEKAGFKHDEIGKMLGKNAAAVAKAISRAKAGRTRAGS